MEGLKRKLCAQQGASLLLALVLLLVCVMTCGGVLSAAVSNAGKQRSNYQTEQRYLAVSSALRLVCDDLKSASYSGRYRFGQWEVTTETYDEAGNPLGTQTETGYTYEQLPGEYSCRLGELFRDELDALFGQKLQTEVEALGGGQATLLPLTSSVCTLTVTPQTGTAADDTVVTVTLSLRPDETTGALTYGILVTAEAGGYEMWAELLPQGDAPGGVGGETDGVVESPAVTWTLGEISKGGAP